MNKLNPLFEAMNDIDDGIVSNAVQTAHRHPMRLKTVLVAAAAAALCAVTAVTAAAVLKAPKEITVNNEIVEPQYSTFTDINGKEWDMYVFDLPEFALGEEVEGRTAVGKIRAVNNPDYPGKWREWMLVDEIGNVFYTGVNNKLIEFYSKDGISNVGFGCANFLSKKYEYVEILADHSKIEIAIVPIGQGNDYLEQKGYLPAKAE